MRMVKSLIRSSIWASLLVATGARGATVTVSSDVSDYGIYSPATVVNGDQIHRVGTEATVNGIQTNVVHLFPLPGLNGGQLVGADYSFNFIERTGTPSFSVDLWGIGIQVGTSPLSEFYFGNSTSNDGFAGNVKLQDNIVVSATAVGLVHTDSIGNANLLNYLNGFYNGNPSYTGGAYVYLRLNHDAEAPSGLSGFVVSMQEYNGPKPLLTLEIAQVPEPSTLLLATLAIVPAGFGRRRVSNLTWPCVAHFRFASLVFALWPLPRGESKTIRRSSTIALLIGLSFTASASAVVTVYDGFSYPAGSALQGASGGIGFSSAWTNSVAVIKSGSLSYGSLPSSGNSVLDSTNSALFNNRTLASPLGLPGTTTYFSFLVQSPLPGPVPQNKSYGLGLLGSKGDLFIGKADALPASTKYVLENFEGAGQVSSGITAVAGVTDFIAVRADFTAGNDTFRLYVNPTVGGTEPVTANAVKSDFDFGTINQVQINGDATFLFDELRIGTTYTDVTGLGVPEPSALALIPVGLRRAAFNRRNSH